MAAFAPRAAELLMGAARAYPPGTEPLPLQALVGVAPSVQQAMLCASILGWADYELAVHRVAAPGDRKCVDHPSKSRRRVCRNCEQRTLADVSPRIPLCR